MKIWEAYNVTETASTGKSIAITPEAFKNENYETQ